MQTTRTCTLEDVLDRFFDLFLPTISLVEELIAKRHNAQEVLLLLCARLDALASSISSEDQSNRDSFTRLIVTYGGYRDLLQSVSAGDLYYELGFHRWLIDGMLPAPGRIARFSRLDDPIIELLDLSEIPLTSDAARQLLTRIIRSVERNFRCRPGQSLTKASTIKSGEITAAIQRDFARSRVVATDALTRAVQPLLRSVTVAELLYQNFRNQAIHGIEVRIDEGRFFQEQRPYWQHLYSEYYGSFMRLSFPAPFILALLRNCLVTLRRAMLARGKVPPDVHWHLFGYDLDNLRFLDTSLLPESRTLRLQRATR